MRIIITVLSLGWLLIVQAQTVSDDQKAIEEKLEASTKQINQFFRRFNGEEDFKGQRIFPDGKSYRERQLRRKFLPELFDQESISENLAEEFQEEVTDRRNPKYIDFHQPEWFAEVRTRFNYQGKSTDLLLFMKIQPQREGYEWVYYDVSFSPFSETFDKKHNEEKPFIHPMSHELGFMNLRKAFASKKGAEQFTPDDYRPDYLTLFIYLVNQELLKFESVSEVKFHFFNIEGWYFELSNFNRPGVNTGWLMSNLVRINDDQKSQLEQYLYGK